MHIGGGPALTAVRRRAAQLVRTPALGVTAVLTPIVLAGAVGAASPNAPTRDSAVMPMAAVAPSVNQQSGVSVVAVTRAQAPFRTVASAASAPPPPVVVSSPGTLRIPSMALSAYRNAETMMAAAYPGCGLSWNLLAGIGRIESMHANGGATDARGTAVRPIYGPSLDGTLPGNEVIVENRSAERVTYARAMGPMQFLPGTWSRYASDGDGDGKAEVQNLFDASLAAARYLCSGNLNLRSQSDVVAAILRYNNSMAYAQNVLSWAAAYATGVVPVDLPPITGSVPEREAATVSSHLDRRQGLGPGLPLTATGLPANDPLALIPLMERTDVASQINTALPGFVPGQTLGPLPGPMPQAMPQPQPAAPPQPAWVPPWMQAPPPKQPQCAVFCIQDVAPAAPAPAPAPTGPLGLLPPAPAPQMAAGPAAPMPGPVPAPAPGPGPAPGPAPGPPA